jgi:hypothetical protein
VAGAGETEGGVGPAALVVHAGEHRDLGVDVVVDLDAGLGVGRSEDTADVLDNAALELDGKGEEQGVEGWAVEAFAEQAGRSGEYEAAVG